MNSRQERTIRLNVYENDKFNQVAVSPMANFNVLVQLLTGFHLEHENQTVPCQKAYNPSENVQTGRVRSSPILFLAHAFAQAPRYNIMYRRCLEPVLTATEPS